MKNFAKFLVIALVVSLIAGVFAFGASAAVTEPGVNPNNLKPGSDRVIFIQDAPRDPKTNMCKWDELPGNGLGISPENPLRPLEWHENFDPTANVPQYDVLTPFYQATEMLAETGGTIVITGPVYFGRKEAYGASATQADTRTAKFGNNVIKFTSVYNGVDYRATNGAKITLEMPAQLNINGSSIWENIDIETASMDRSMNFHFYATKIGEGVKTYPADEIFVDVPNYYVSLAGGHRYAKSTGENPTLLVQSGTYNKIVAQWGGPIVEAKDMTSYITVEGTTTVKGILCGTVHQAIKYSGHVNITINGGIFEGDINGVGPTGFANADGVVRFEINGGNFGNAYSINAADIINRGNAPAATIVDFSGWKGSYAQLAYAVALAADEASGIDAKFIKLPAGKTISELVEYAYENPYYVSNEDGWQNIGGTWYYFQDGDYLANVWMKDSNGWCYLGSDCGMVTNGFAKDSKGWCYIGADGYCETITGWKYINGCWYYVNKGYRVQNSWKNDGASWYYLGSDGTIVTNTWKKDSNGWCYLGSDGKMVTNGFVKDSSGWCYIGANGYCETTTGWKYVDGHWYYLNKGYRVQNSWKLDGSSWYYLGADGKIVTNTWIQDSKGWCYLGADGKMLTNAWKQDSNGWYYLGSDGKAVTNTWMKDSKGWCYLSASGKMVTNGFVKDSKGWCFIGADGYCVTTTGWKYFNGYWYYLNKGYRVQNAWKLDGSSWYYLGSEGKMVTSSWMKDSKGWCYLGSDGKMLTNTYVYDSNGKCWLNASGYWNGQYVK